MEGPSLSSSTPDPFSPEIGAAVTAHMNGDHPEDCVLIVRGLAGLPEAEAASMTGISPAGACFNATVDGHARDVVVPWGRPILERGDLRLDVVRMYHEACAALGIEPRTAEQH